MDYTGVETFSSRCKGFHHGGNLFSAGETCYENLGYREKLHVPYGPPSLQSPPHLLLVWAHHQNGGHRRPI